MSEQSCLGRGEDTYSHAGRQAQLAVSLGTCSCAVPRHPKSLTGEVMATLLLSLVSTARFLPKMKPALQGEQGREAGVRVVAAPHAPDKRSSCKARGKRAGQLCMGQLAQMLLHPTPDDSIFRPAKHRRYCSASQKHTHIWRKPWPSACRISMSPPAMVTSATR